MQFQTHKSPIQLEFMTYPIIALLCNPTPTLGSGHISKAGVIPSSKLAAAPLCTRIALQHFCILILESLVVEVLGHKVGALVRAAPGYDKIPRLQHSIDHDEARQLDS